MANIIVSALATWNGKALKKGQKEISAFDKTVKNLGKTFAGAFGTYQILAFSKKAINAFAADERAAKSLAVQLENTGNAFRISEVEDYIFSLQQLYGVLDDQLRPAFQTLLNATGSVTLSQRALETALNVSAGTGKDLSSVVAAIAKGAAGSTTAITRLGTGLDKTTIATGDMNKIMAALDQKFKGQALARLDTYAGKMDLLRVNAANATEIIGKGLIDAITILGRDNSIDQAADSMNNFANAIANTTKGMAELIAEVKKIVDSDVGKFLLGLAALLTLGKKTLIAGTAGLIAYDIGKSKPPASNFQYGAGNPMFRKQEAKAIKDAVTFRKLENAQLKAKTAVQQLQDKFDLERIGLTAALNSATDEETKLRIRAQLAILDNNEALAKKILEEMKAAEAAKKLAEEALKAASALTALGTFDPARFRMGENRDLGMDSIQLLMALTAMQGLASGLVPLAGLGGMAGNAAETLAYGQSYSNVNVGTPGGGIFDPSFFRQAENRDLVITVDTSQTQDKFAQLVAESIQIATKTGISYGIAGGL